jgi:LemA protein
MKNYKLVLIITAVVVAIALMCVFMVQGAQNGAINREEQIESAQSDIKVQEKRRADLIPNLADCVKQYDKHEYNTLMNVIKVRGTNTDTSVNEVKTMINAVAEQYPQLQANTNYKQLMNELSVTENLIAEYRSNFNKQVKEYNRYVRKFPTRFFLSMTGYEVLEYEYLNYDVSSDAPTNLFGE